MENHQNVILDIRILYIKNSSTSYTLIVNNIEIDKINLNIPGEHNILNSLAAIGVALELNIPINIIKK